MIIVNFLILCVRRLNAIRRQIVSTVVRAYLKALGVQVGSNLIAPSFPICRKHIQATIRIGRNVTILNKLVENMAGIIHPTVLVASMPGAQLIIGDHVGISGAILYCTDKIIIEDYVDIGANVKVFDSDFHPLAFESRKAGGTAYVAHAPVVLGMGCWIGADAIILKGTHVGARAVVAAGAVVTKDVPPDTIVAGVPARPVGKVPPAPSSATLDVQPLRQEFSC